MESNNQTRTQHRRSERLGRAAVCPILTHQLFVRRSTFETIGRRDVFDWLPLPNDAKTERFRIPIRDGQGRITHILSASIDITARKLRELEEQQRQAEIIEHQAATLAELSTPLLVINDTTVVMPLVGAIDSRRVQQIMSVLLDGIATYRAEIAIVDITGVPVVDTQVANALIRAAQSVKLLGAQVVLTGLRPEVAQTIVGLGVNLSEVVTRGTLQGGIAFADTRYTC